MRGWKGWSGVRVGEWKSGTGGRVKGLNNELVKEWNAGRMERWKNRSLVQWRMERVEEWKRMV